MGSYQLCPIPETARESGPREHQRIYMKILLFPCWYKTIVRKLRPISSYPWWLGPPYGSYMGHIWVRYFKFFEDECVFFVVMHLMYSRVENRIYWDAVALSSIRGEILIATNLTSLYFKQHFSWKSHRFSHWPPSRTKTVFPLLSVSIMEEEVPHTALTPPHKRKSSINTISL